MTKNSTDAAEPAPELQPRSRARRLLGRALRGVAGIVLTVLAVLLLLLAALQTEGGRAWTVQFVTEVVSDSIRGEVRVDRLRGNLLNALGIDGVQIYGPDGELALAIDRVDVRLTPTAALAQVVQIDRLELHGLRVPAAVDAEGLVPLAMALEPMTPAPQEPDDPDAPPTAWQVEVRELVISGVSVRVSPADDAPGFDHLGFDGALSMRPEGVRWHIANLEARLVGLPVEALSLSTSGLFTGDAVEVADLVIHAAPHSLRLRGSVSDLSDDPEFDLLIDETNLDLARLGVRELQGAAAVMASVRGRLSHLRAQLDIISTAGHVTARVDGGVRDGIPHYDLQVEGVRIRPSSALPAIEPAVELDVMLAAEGLGDPMAPGGDAALRLELPRLEGIPGVPPVHLNGTMHAGAIEAQLTARDAGGALDARISLPSLDTTEARAAILAEGVQLASWARALDMPGLDGWLHGMRADLAIDLTAAPRPKVRGVTTLELSSLVLPPELGGGVSVGDLEVEVTLTPVAAGQAVSGHLGVWEVRRGSAARVRKVRLPFDLVVADDDGPVTGELDVVVSGARYDDIRVDEVRLDAHLEGRVAGMPAVSGPLVVRALRVGADTRIEEIRVAADVSISAVGTVVAAFGLAVNGVGAPGGAAVAGLSGEVEVRLPGADLQRLEADGSLRAQDVRVGTDVALREVDLTFDVGVSDGAPIGTLGIAARGARVQAQALRAIELALVLPTGRDHGSLTLMAGGPRLSIDAALALAGPLNVASPIAAIVQRGRVGTGPFGFHLDPGGSVTFTPSTGRIEAAGLVVRHVGKAPSSVEVAGSWSPSGAVAARLRSERLPIAAWVATLADLGLAIEGTGPLDGALTVDVDVTGTLRSPTATVAMDLADGRFGSLEALGVTVQATVDRTGTHATIGAGWGADRTLALELSTPRRVGLDGDPRIRSDDLVAVTVEVANVDLRDFSQWIPAQAGGPVRGQLGASLEFHGSALSPSGTFELDLERFGAGRNLTAAVHIAADLDPEAMSTSLVLSAKGRERMRIQATVPDNIMKVLEQAPSSLPIAVVASLAPTDLTDLPFIGQLGATGSVNAEFALDLGGTLGAPTLDGHVSVGGLPVQTTTARVGLDLATREGRLHGAYTATSRGRELLDGTLVIPLAAAREGLPALLERPDFVVVGTTQLPGSAVSELNQAAGRLLVDAIEGANVDVSFVFRGGDAETRVLTARAGAASPTPELGIRKMGLASSARAVLEMREDATRFNVVVDQSAHGGHLTITGGAEIGLSDVVAGDVEDVAFEGVMISKDFSLDGLDKAMPSAFGPTRGQLDAHATFGGTPSDLQFEGQVAARFSELYLLGLGLQQRDVDLVVDFDRSKLGLVPLHFRKRKGTMDVTFEMDLASLDPAEMGLRGGVKLEAFEVLDRRSMRVKATGEITIAGTVAEPHIAGLVVVDDALLQPDFGGRDVQAIGVPADVVFVSAGDTVLEAEGHAVTDAADGAAGSLGMIVDVTIDVPPRHMLVKNDMVEVLLEGDIEARTKGGAISVSGIITILGGELELFGLTFELMKDSKVILDGSPVINPILDINAALDISDVDLSPIGLETDRDSRILARVSGTALQPELILSSDPPMGETQILSILAIGKPIGDTTSSGSDDEGSMEDTMIATVVGIAMGQVSTLVIQNLPVDVFELEAGGERGFEETEFRIGKRITRDLMLLYEMNLGAQEWENVHQLRMEYAITGNINLDTHFGDLGQGGAELMLRWKF